MIAELNGIRSISVTGCPLVLIVPVVPPMLVAHDLVYISARTNVTMLRFNLDKVIEADSSGPLRARYVIDTADQSMLQSARL